MFTYTVSSYVFGNINAFRTPSSIQPKLRGTVLQAWCFHVSCSLHVFSHNSTDRSFSSSLKNIILSVWCLCLHACLCISFGPDAHRGSPRSHQIHERFRSQPPGWNVACTGFVQVATKLLWVPGCRHLSHLENSSALVLPFLQLLQSLSLGRGLDIDVPFMVGHITDTLSLHFGQLGLSLSHCPLHREAYLMSSDHINEYRSAS